MLLSNKALPACGVDQRRGSPPKPVGSRALPGRAFSVLPQRRVAMRAEGGEGTSSSDSEKIMKDLKTQWDAIENKPQVALYATGGVFGLWLTSTVIGAINHVPLLPKLFEFVGLAYSTWFTYRYLLFQGSRDELLADVEELKSKITGK